MQAVPTSGGGESSSAIGAEAQSLLLRLAREAVQAAASGKGSPPREPEGLPAVLREPRACFVTLHRNEVLRGCIGQLTAREPLWEAAAWNAAKAATKDWRFPPVSADEVIHLRIEISVLTPPVRWAALPAEVLLSRLRPGIDGVVLEVEGHLSTFLPQVWGDLSEPQQFMNRLAEKAGCEASAWRSPEARISVYQVESFEEPESP